MQVVVAAGGQGARMSELLGEVPKVLAPVGGTAFLTLVLREYLRQEGVRVHLLLGARCDAVLEELEASFPGDPRITHSVEATPLGVGGALALAAAEGCLADELVLTYGDVYPTMAPQRLADALTDDAEGVMTTCPVQLAGEPGNCVVADGRVLEYRKGLAAPTHVDGGMTLLRRRALDLLEPGAFAHEGALYAQLAARGQLRCVPRNHPSIHIGDPAAYRSAVAHLTTESQP